MKKSGIIILSGLFLSAIVSCSESSNNQTKDTTVKYDKSMETKEENGSSFVHYMGMWYLLNRATGTFDTSNSYRSTSNGFVKNPVTPKQGGFGTTGKSSSSFSGS